ncbi:hypothetical protein MNEG_5086, partial [Monoraphidium neglectum]
VHGVTFNPYHPASQGDSTPGTSARSSPRPSPRPVARPFSSPAPIVGEDLQPLMFATWGVKHVKFWVRSWDE